MSGNLVEVVDQDPPYMLKLAVVWGGECGPSGGHICIQKKQEVGLWLRWS